jgi:sulfate adenylyltransferase
VDHLNPPHGGTLVDLLVDDERRAELKQASLEWPSWDLTPRQICDLELIMNGGFSPLTGFLGQADYESVCEKMRLADGTLWPLPITLDVTEEVAEKLEKGKPLALRDPEGTMLAVLTVDDMWKLDRETKAQAVYGTLDRKHPGVAHLFERTNNIAVGGRVEGIELPPHYDFVRFRLTPEQTRRRFTRLGWRKIVAFQTRNPMHRAHYELTLRAARDLQANLLIHPVVGMTKPGDVDHYTRVRCYQALAERYPRNTALMSLLPLAMRMGGPREAVLHAIIRKNYGCSHFIVGRDHAGPGVDSNGHPFYDPYEAQELVREHEKELGIDMVPFKMVVYVEDKDAYFPIDEIPEDTRTLNISGTELRERLAKGRELPEWFTFPEVADQLRRTHPPRYKQGFTVFFTGLSGSGKSTVANVLMVKLLEMGGRPVTLLDGDIVRKNLSSELGFSKEHRDPAHRICCLRDHQERRHRHLRPHRPLRVGPQPGARDDHPRRRLHPGARLHPARCLRDAGPQGPLCQGSRRCHPTVHRDLGSLRGAREPRGRHRHHRSDTRRVSAADHSVSRARGLHRRHGRGLGLLTPLRS